ncbi:MAG TPA: hypothetical protein IAA83_02830 [Candidatus Avoscillospira avistercoris]|uniref:Uncharacterized protein n=1 Tax=Candidatus Avoscillospira avistercoris TaxID=2840707 RepID=A0A9D1F8Y6_9FIRM|nr:hypothetical protein [Candidatus Avoscillospira avistercoris]
MWNPYESNDRTGDVRYFGYAVQQVAPAGELLMARYCPAEDTEPSPTVYLPGGRYLIAYSVNASAAEPAASDTATLGIAPRFNGVPFPRGGSFATVPDDGSAPLNSTFVITLPRAVNTLSFTNTGSLNTSYQLLNVTVSRLR